MLHILRIYGEITKALQEDFNHILCLGVMLNAIISTNYQKTVMPL